MTYVIEGKIRTREKPEIYLNNFFHRSLKGDTEVTINIPWKGAARQFELRGYEMTLVKDLEQAEQFCVEKEKGIFISRQFAPKEGWSSYLSNKFSESKTTKTLEGELNVWGEFHFPTPWVYCFAHGSLKGRYFFSGRNFVQDPNLRSHGTRTTIGIVTPLTHIKKTKTSVYEHEPEIRKGLRILPASIDGVESIVYSAGLP